MKKQEIKNILKKFTWIDFIIILLFIGAIIFAFIQIGSDDENKKESISFDSSTLNKLGEKYLSFYREGQIVRTHVGGYNATNGKYQELYGTILWEGDYKGSNVKILIDVDKKPVLAGLYKDVKNADIYIEHITLETNGEKYKNVTEIKVKPKNITKLDELSKEIPNGTNYTITTEITIDPKNVLIYQDLDNELYFKVKRDSIRTETDSTKDKINILMAQNEEINIGSQIIGSFNGKTSIITIRIYNTTEKDIEAVKKDYNIINIRKIS